MFITPMFASPMPKPTDRKQLIFGPGRWSGEIKYDGMRLVSEISDKERPSLFVQKGIKAWSRYGNEQVLPTHLLQSMERLPDGVYDGELIVPGQRTSGDVGKIGSKELANIDRLVYVIFDIIHLEEVDFTDVPRRLRRQVLETTILPALSSSLWLAPSYPVDTWEDACKLYAMARERNEEGIILKLNDGSYEVGKRSKSFVKMKDKKSAVLTVVAWQESRGEKVYRGKYATAVIKDSEGFTTTVKTKNDATLEALEREAQRTGSGPYIGRSLRIEYQERTPDGSYRHPRWDRWEDE
jgi:bifunctional non-homologous end joining protein LigD